ARDASEGDGGGGGVIRERASAGDSIASIARVCGLSRVTVYAVLKTPAQLGSSWFGALAVLIRGLSEDWAARCRRGRLAREAGSAAHLLAKTAAKPRPCRNRSDLRYAVNPTVAFPQQTTSSPNGRRTATLGLTGMTFSRAMP